MVAFCKKIETNIYYKIIYKMTNVNKMYIVTLNYDILS
jgi:hypothetical protein